MRKSHFLLLLLLLCGKLYAQTNYNADNGLSLDNSSFKLGGDLNRSTLINGNFKALRFTNIDTFFLGGRYIQMLNSTRKTYISSFDSLYLQSFADILLSASNSVAIDGKIKMLGYKNNVALDSILTVDNCGNLKLVSQGSLQTISQNAFTRNGNTFGAAAYLGTNDKQFLYFKTNNINRGYIDTVGTLNYNYPVNINNGKLKIVSSDIEINGAQDYVTSAYQKAKMGLNFVWATEPLPRGTISFNPGTSSMNYTAHGSFRFYSSQGGIPQSNVVPDLLIANSVFRFGGKYARSNADEPSAAYQFKEYIDPYGIPKGILLPPVSYSFLRNYINAPADGLIIFNKETHNLEIFKPDGWHKFLTQNVNPPVTIAAAAPATSFVQPLGDGKQKVFTVNHNLNSGFVMVQFIDCGAEANCNLLMNAPDGVRVELDGKNSALITFKSPPSIDRYKVMFLKVQ